MRLVDTRTTARLDVHITENRMEDDLAADVIDGIAATHRAWPLEHATIQFTDNSHATIVFEVNTKSLEDGA